MNLMDWYLVATNCRDACAARSAKKLLRKLVHFRLHHPITFWSIFLTLICSRASSLVLNVWLRNGAIEVSRTSLRKHEVWRSDTVA